MKKLVFNFFALAMVALSMTMVSCDEDDDNNNVAEVMQNLENGVLNGTLTESVELNPTVTYQLTGKFIVPEGLKLTIPAGTQITAEAGGTNVYIAVLMGGMIDIQGTAAEPVLMTSPNAEGGDWGGLTICGKATTSAGAGAIAEVGNFVYGGSDDADNSGSIEYLVIKGTGAQINADSQYNGVSFYAVGSATTVENLAVINGSDDGVEFFGGSVSVTNLFLQNNEDDAIDWTEGWNGTVTNSYIEHTVAGFSTAVEADKVNNNPKLINLTAVSTVGGTALQFKAQSGATITGLSLTGYETSIDMKNDGPLANVIIEEEEGDTLKSYTAPATVDPSSWTWTAAEITDGVTELLGQGIMNGVLTSNYTLDAAVEYNLTGSFIVNEGATLTIPAGTKIKAEASGTSVYIAVFMGGKIDVQGTTDAPVVMSSENGEPSDWGGLTICGKATTTAGENAIAEVGNFQYGGTLDNDNSGSIKNLVIRGTGAQINADSQYNGISLYAVGSETVLENISIIDGADDGIEFFGGSAVVKNIYIENCEDDAVDWTEGWNGGIENTYISHTVAGFSTAFEGDKVNNNPTFTNVTAISTVDGIGLQFKAQSGATITGLYLEGYAVDVNMKNAGPLENVKIGGATADVVNADGDAGEKKNFTLKSGKDAAKVDADAWTWKSATL